MHKLSFWHERMFLIYHFLLALNIKTVLLLDSNILMQQTNW